jgi:hypothetical protein
MFKKPPPVIPHSRLARAVEGKSAASTAAPAARAPRAPRQATFRNGVLLFNDVRMVVVIRDLSATGARVDFLQRVELPIEVVLLEAMLKLRKHARVVWQQDGAAGLVFDAG